MPAYTFFHPHLPNQGEKIWVQGEEAHHMIRVMRLEIGATISMIDGKGGCAIAIIEEIEKKRVSLCICKKEMKLPPVPVILAFGIPRFARIDGIIEKGTELGVTAFWPFPAKKSEKTDMSPTQLERYRNITRAAAKQCGRWWVPEIVVQPALHNWSHCPLPAYFGDLSLTAPLLQDCLPEKETPLLFFTGPEAGFTREEQEKLLSLGVKGVRLHDSILRTDTASIVAMALFTHRKREEPVRQQQHECDD